MKRVVLLCDGCSTHIPVTTPTTELAITWPNGSTTEWHGDHCDSCATKFQERINEALDGLMEFKAATPRRGRRPAPRPTPGTIVPSTETGPLMQSTTPVAMDRAAILHASGNTVSREHFRGTESEDKRTCSVCAADPDPEVRYVGPSRSALAQHLKTKHDTNFTKLGEALPGGPARDANGRVISGKAPVS